MTCRGSLNRLKNVVKSYTEADDLLAGEDDNYFSTLFQSKKKSNTSKKKAPNGGGLLSQPSEHASSSGVLTEDRNAGGLSRTSKEKKQNDAASSSLLAEEERQSGVCVDVEPHRMPKSDTTSAIPTITTAATSAITSVVLSTNTHSRPSSVTSPEENGAPEHTGTVPIRKDENASSIHSNTAIDHTITIEKEEERKEIERESVDDALLRKQTNTTVEERRDEGTSAVAELPSKEDDRTSQKKGNPEKKKSCVQKCDLLEVLLCCDCRLLNISEECRRRFGAFTGKDEKQKSRNENSRGRGTEDGGASSTGGDRSGQAFTSRPYRLSSMFFPEHPPSYFPPCFLATPSYCFWPIYKMFTNGQLALRSDRVPKHKNAPSCGEKKDSTRHTTVKATDHTKGKASSFSSSTTADDTLVSSGSSHPRGATLLASAPPPAASRPPCSGQEEKKKKEFYMKREIEDVLEHAKLQEVQFQSAIGIPVEWEEWRYCIPFLLLSAKECKVNGMRLEEHAFIDMALFEVGVLFETCKGFEYSCSWQEREIMQSTSTERIFDALKVGVLSAMQRGCPGSAFEMSRLLLSLNRHDPAGALLSLDYIALRAKKWSWLLQICDQAEAIVFQSFPAMPGFPPSFFSSPREPILHWYEKHTKRPRYIDVNKLMTTTAHRLCCLPGFAFGAAMACYFAEKEEKEKVHKTAASLHRKSDSNSGTTPTASAQPTLGTPSLCGSDSRSCDSVNRLRKAVLRFPVATVALVEALGGWNSLVASTANHKEKESREGDGREMLDVYDTPSTAPKSTIWDLIQLAASSFQGGDECPRVELRAYFPSFSASTTQNEGVQVATSASAQENGSIMDTERCESVPLYCTNDNLCKKGTLMNAIVHIFVHQNLPLWKASDFRFVLCDILQEYVEDVDTTTSLHVSSPAYVLYDPGTFGGMVDVFSDSRRKEAQVLYEYVLRPLSFNVFHCSEKFYLKAEKFQCERTGIEEMQAALSAGDQ